MRRVRQKILTHDRFIPIRKGPPAVGRGFLSLSKEREPFVNGAEGCVRETRKGVLHDDDPHFSELLEALKNASAWRKDFSPRKKGIPAAFAVGIPFFDEISVKHNSITVRLSHPYTAERRPLWPSSLG